MFTGPQPASPTGIQEVYTAQANGTAAIQRTSDGTPKFLPHFSPDGRFVLYTKFLVGGYGNANAQTDIARLDLETGSETLLTGTRLAIDAVWSPDGKSVVYTTLNSDAMWLMDADGSAPHIIARPGGQLDDLTWSDFAWSSDNWIYFVVQQRSNGCFKTRIDRIRPDGSGRTQITDGGPNCTPAGFEQSGDADPGISPDGKTLYSSRGLPIAAPNHPTVTIRHLYRIDTTPWQPGKIETDLSTGSTASCVTGVPKVSPDGTRLAVFLFCPDNIPQFGIETTDLSSSAYTRVIQGFGADWNPVAK